MPTPKDASEAAYLLPPSRLYAFEGGAGTVRPPTKPQPLNFTLVAPPAEQAASAEALARWDADLSPHTAHAHHVAVDRWRGGVGTALPPSAGAQGRQQAASRRRTWGARGVFRAKTQSHPKASSDTGTAQGTLA